MSESVPEEEPWPVQVTAMVAKLAGATRITWGSGGNWRSQHVIALKDLSLPSRDEPYSLEEGATVFIDKRTYPAGPYQLWDRKIIPVSNVRIKLEGEPPKPAEGGPSGARSSASFYIGTVTTTYSYDPPPITIKKGRTALLLGEEDESHYLVQDRSGGNFEGSVEAGSVKVCEVGQTLPNHEAEPIELMCWELFPYAALRAKLLSDKKFFEWLRTPRDQSGSEDWAGFLGATLAGKPKLDPKTSSFDRGDIIVFYDQQDAGIHTATAFGKTAPEGGGPLVYSLADSAVKNPVLWPIAKVAGDLGQGYTVTYLKAFTPRPPK